MLGIYLFALALGGVLLAAGAIAEIGGDSDGLDGAGEWLSFLNLRNATYVLFVFGATGALLTWLPTGVDSATTLLLAAAAALGVGALVHAVFAWVRRTDASPVPGDDALVGLPARVIVPVAAGAIGKIQLLHAGRSVELLARPFAAEPAAPAGSEVVIVAMAQGTALVAPLSEALPGPRPPVS